MARHTIELRTYNTNGRQAQRLSHAVEHFANEWLKNEHTNAGLNADHPECPSAYCATPILERAD